MPHIAPKGMLTIGELAKRAGVTVPPRRYYYEQRRLIDAIRPLADTPPFPATPCAGSRYSPPVSVSDSACRKLPTPWTKSPATVPRPSETGHKCPAAGHASSRNASKSCNASHLTSTDVSPANASHSENAG